MNPASITTYACGLLLVYSHVQLSIIGYSKSIMNYYVHPWSHPFCVLWFEAVRSNSFSFQSRLVDKNSCVFYSRAYWIEARTHGVPYHQRLLVAAGEGAQALSIVAIVRFGPPCTHQQNKAVSAVRSPRDICQLLLLTAGVLERQWSLDYVCVQYGE